ncbi:MAG: hypothetical protein IT376_12330 [Polyangiaceae bacterium]|nr:hypothetical protein [Polyangiaceae bacterium]
MPCGAGRRGARRSGHRVVPWALALAVVCAGAPLRADPAAAAAVDRAPGSRLVELSIEGADAEADAVALAISEPLARLGVVTRRVAPDGAEAPASAGAPPLARAAVRLDAAGAALAVRDGQGVEIAERTFDTRANREVLYEEIAHALQSIIEAMLSPVRAPAPVVAARPARGRPVARRARPAPERRARLRAGPSLGLGWFATGRGATWGAGLGAAFALDDTWSFRYDALRWLDVESQPAGVAVDVRHWSVRVAPAATLARGDAWRAAASLGAALWLAQPAVRPAPELLLADAPLVPAVTASGALHVEARLASRLELVVSPLLEWAPVVRSYVVEAADDRRLAFRRSPLAVLLTAAITIGEPESPRRGAR